MSLPFWWLLLTAVYVTLTFLGGGYIAGLLGFFVPIGIWNLFFSIAGPANRLFEHPWIITFPLVLITVSGGEYILRKINSNALIRFLLIFLILFILTIAVDLIIWQDWHSLGFFMAGAKVKCC